MKRIAMISVLLALVCGMALANPLITKLVRKTVEPSVMKALTDKFPTVSFSCGDVSVIQKSEIDFSMMMGIVTKSDEKQHYITVHVLAGDEDTQWSIDRDDLLFFLDYE